jgi:hypothetical protein
VDQVLDAVEERGHVKVEQVALHVCAGAAVNPQYGVPAAAEVLHQV